MTDLEHVVALIRGLSDPEVWDEHTRHLDSGEYREFKRQQGVVVEALQRRTPMDVKLVWRGSWYDRFCPVCGKRLKAPGAKTPVGGCFCENCGQKLRHQGH